MLLHIQPIFSYSATLTVHEPLASTHKDHLVFLQDSEDLLAIFTHFISVFSHRASSITFYTSTLRYSEFKL